MLILLESIYPRHLYNLYTHLQAECCTDQTLQTKISQLILTQCSLPSLYKLEFAQGATSICLLSIQRQSLVLPTSPSPLFPFSFPPSSVSVSDSKPLVPLGQINLHCAENLFLLLCPVLPLVIHNHFHKALLWPPHMCCGMHAHTQRSVCAHTLIKSLLCLIPAIITADTTQKLKRYL